MPTCQHCGGQDFRKSISFAQIIGGIVVLSIAFVVWLPAVGWWYSGEEPWVTTAFAVLLTWWGWQLVLCPKGWFVCRNCGARTERQT